MNDCNCVEVELEMIENEEDDLCEHCEKRPAMYRELNSDLLVCDVCAGGL